MANTRGRDLGGGELLFVLLPLGLEAVAGLGAVAGLLLRQLVRVVLLGRLLRVEVPEPVRELLQRRRAVERVRVGRRTREAATWGGTPVAMVVYGTCVGG
jgi:hypothetical protein